LLYCMFFVIVHGAKQKIYLEILHFDKLALPCSIVTKNFLKKFASYEKRLGLSNWKTQS
jgi:hypothetical protein